MTNKTRLADVPDFDPAEHLKGEDDIAAYLAVVLEENDPALLATALGDIERGVRHQSWPRIDLAGLDLPPWENRRG